jgi:hypothetical protein
MSRTDHAYIVHMPAAPANRRGHGSMPMTIAPAAPTTSVRRYSVLSSKRTLSVGMSTKARRAPRTRIWVSTPIRTVRSR